MPTYIALGTSDGEDKMYMVNARDKASVEDALNFPPHRPYPPFIRPKIKIEHVVEYISEHSGIVVKCDQKLLDAAYAHEMRYNIK